MTFKAALEIPLLKGQEYKSHYFTHPSEGHGWENLGEHFGIYNRCMLRENISAHRLDSYMIFLVTSGEGLHTFGSKAHYVRKNMLGFIGPNVVSSWKSEGDDNRGFICSFSDQFFNINRSDRNYLPMLPFFQLDGEQVLWLSDEEAHEFKALFNPPQSHRFPGL